MLIPCWSREFATMRFQMALPTIKANTMVTTATREPEIPLNESCFIVHSQGYHGRNHSEILLLVVMHIGRLPIFRILPKHLRVMVCRGVMEIHTH